MEERLWSSAQQSLKDDEPPSLQVLSSIRSLIVNPHTSSSTISSILETLTRSLSHTTSHHTLKLLTDLASFHPHLSPLVCQSLHSNSLLSADSAAESIAALSSISDRSLRTELDDRLFLSLCFGPSVAQRLRLLRSAEKLGVQPHVLFTVFLGFTKDPYPYVRKVALDGLVGLCGYGAFQDRSVVEGCYYRGVELLRDAENCVRSAAVRLVREWGQVIIAASEEEDKRIWSDTVFIQLCSMVRDMDLEVRVEAFLSIGKIKLVSEGILLQTLSKKVLPVMREKISYRLYIEKSAEIFAANAAGAFVHGLEDEYHEVRQSVCYSLRNLVTLSTEFADRALNFLMDILNDDSLTVRSEALDTLHLMAVSECLNVKEMHMHMFIGTLSDSQVLTRSAARKIFKLVKLPNLGLFRLCIDGLLQSLEKFPQEEADVFSVLFHMGCSHGNFVASIVGDVSQEIEPVSDGNLGLDNPRVAAFLVLFISLPLSHEQAGQRVPPRFFSYAVTLLGRMSSALCDIMDQNALLAYLIQCSRSSPGGSKVDGEESSGDEVIGASSSCAVPLHQMGSENSEIQSMVLSKSVDVRESHVEHLLKESDLIKDAMNLILGRMNDVWLLVQLRCINEALKTLRVCKEELTMLTSSLPEFSSALEFAKQYLKVIKLLTKLWGQIMWKVQKCKIGEIEILLQKLERTLRRMRCQFIGLSKEEELHVLELTLVAYVLRLSTIEISCCSTTLKRLSASITQMEVLQKETSSQLPNFVTEVKKTLHEVNNSSGGCPGNRFLTLLTDYSLKECRIGGEIKTIYGEVNVADNDSEHPTHFVSGLPVSIPLEITLHNVMRGTRLWLRMKMDEDYVQFVFIDLNLYGGWGKTTNFNFVAPFYRTKSVSFTLRVSIGMEWMFEDGHIPESYGGPKRSLVYICPEKEVYLYRM